MDGIGDHLLFVLSCLCYTVVAPRVWGLALFCTKDFVARNKKYSSLWMGIVEGLCRKTVETPA